MGAESVRDLMKKLDLESEIQKIEVDLENTRSVQNRKKLTKRMKLLSAFAASNTRPEWMIPRSFAGHSARPASACAPRGRPVRDE